MCEYIASDVIYPGYICCRCRHYNGLQRKNCRVCGEEHHKLQLSEETVLCKTCGAAISHGLEYCPVCCSDKTPTLDKYVK